MSARPVKVSIGAFQNRVLQLTIIDHFAVPDAILD